MVANNMNKKTLVEVNSRYKSSTRIDTAVGNYEQFVDSFILHGTAINVLDTISRDFDGSEQRAYTMTGPYGSGKSTIALYLSTLLSGKVDSRNHAIKKLQKADSAFKQFHKRMQVKNGWKTVTHVCGLESPANAILINILNAFKAKYDLEEINKLNDEECLTRIRSVLDSSKGKHDGVLHLHDEMGKALD